MAILSFVGCSDESDNRVTPPIPEDATYDVNYTVNSISDDIFDLGLVIISYIDNNGEEHSDIYEKSDLPFTVTFKGLDAEDLIYFEVIFGKNGDISDEDLTKDKYNLSMDAYYKVRSSYGKSEECDFVFDFNPSKANVMEYMDQLLEAEYMLPMQEVEKFLNY